MVAFQYPIEDAGRVSGFQSPAAAGRNQREHRNPDLGSSHLELPTANGDQEICSASLTAITFMRRVNDFFGRPTDKPVIILNNNDGCAIARSQEAKDLGIKMGDAFYKIEKLIKENDIQVFSSNYTLVC
jgi:hypothetical protein